MTIRRILIITAYTVPAICIFAVLAFNILIQVISHIGIGLGFGMNNLDETWITNETMRGKVVLYNFTYTNCGGPCDQTEDGNYQFKFVPMIVMIDGC